MICYFGHHRSGSSYIRAILESVATLTGHTTSSVHNLDELKLSEHASLLITTNSSKEYLNTIKFNRAFHVIRDPRDVVVSSYFSHLLSHKTDIWKELTDHREQLKALSKEDGMIYEIETCRKQQFIDLNDWDYKDARILEIKFEDFIQDLNHSWRKVFAFLDLSFSENQSIHNEMIHFNNKVFRKLNRKFPAFDFNALLIKQTPSYQQLEKILIKNEFNRRTGRKPGSEDINHHYRKGIIGDWQNHFTPQIKDCFKSNWGDLLIKLGYEKDLNW